MCACVRFYFGTFCPLTLAFGHYTVQRFNHCMPHANPSLSRISISESTITTIRNLAFMCLVRSIPLHIFKGGGNIMQYTHICIKQIIIFATQTHTYKSKVVLLQYKQKQKKPMKERKNERIQYVEFLSIAP